MNVPELVIGEDVTVDRRKIVISAWGDYEPDHTDWMRLALVVMDAIAAMYADVEWDDNKDGDTTVSPLMVQIHVGDKRT